MRSDVESEGQARRVVTFGAIFRLAPVPLYHHMNAVRFRWILCALLALRGHLEKNNNERKARPLCAL